MNPQLDNPYAIRILFADDSVFMPTALHPDDRVQPRIAGGGRRKPRSRV
jgi:hypothetical protein